MKKIFNFTKKKKGFSPNASDSGSVLSVGYDLKDKDLGKVHKAASVGDLAKLKQLAKKNDINQLDKENRTALHIACANGHAEVVQFLVESKAKLNLCDNQNRSALMKAVQSQQDRCVAPLLGHEADPNLLDINGNTALHLAACIPAISTASLLLEHKANINAQNKEGYTPLTMAVKENHIEMAEFLLKEGANVNTADQGRRSPLMIAACNGQISMVRLLLQCDADITVKDTNGWSSDDYAVMNGHHACSHLIIEHGTKRRSMPSPSHLVPSKKKQSSVMGSSSQGVEAGFTLGGPATDRDDTEDNSQTESVSRASKSAADDWPSSDEDDDSDLSPKKPNKLNLKKLMGSAKKRSNSADPPEPWRKAECEGESQDRQAQSHSSLPKALPLSSRNPQHLISPSPSSFSKPPQMTSTPVLSSRKEKDSDEEEGDEEEEREEGESKEVGEVVKGKMNHQTEEDDSLTAGNQTPVPKSDNSKEQQRDFLSELGLEKGEDEDDSWDSESCSDSPKKPHREDQSSLTKAHIMSSISEEGKEDRLYVPSFSRGLGSYRTPCVEQWRSGGSQGAVLKNDPEEEEEEDEEDVAVGNGNDTAIPDKEIGRIKREPLSFISKLELSKGDADRKTDIMDELGLGDVDDLEESPKNLADASDWDTASTTSRRTLPGRRVPSPGAEQLPEAFPVPLPEAQEQDAPPVPPPGQRSSRNSGGRSSPADTPPLPIPRSSTPRSPGLSLPCPQPRVRKTLPQRAESEEDSDWDSDQVASTSSLLKAAAPLPNIAESEGVLSPEQGVREPSPEDQERENSPELGEELPEEEPPLEEPLLREESPVREGSPLEEPPTRKESPLEEPQLREESPLEEDFPEEERPIEGPPEVSHERRRSSLEVQKSSSLWAAGQPGRQAERELLEEEPERESRSLYGAAQMEQKLKAGGCVSPRLGSNSPKSAIRAPEEPQAPLQQHLSGREERGAVARERTPRGPPPERAGGARRRRAPPAHTHLNGDPLSVFDDSTVSDVSDDDGRSPSAGSRRDKIQPAGDMEMAEDFDELTQSSDTGTEDMDTPASGYHHASLLIKQLDATSLDSVSVVKLQNMFHEYERTIHRERGRHARLADKLSQLEGESGELRGALEDVRDLKSGLEHKQLELETDLNNLKFQLKQETEKHRNASMLYEKTRVQLGRKEEQQRAEAEDKQTLQLSLRNLELDMRTLANNNKQLEDDRSDMQRLLAQERSARALQESLLSSHLRRQQEVEEENRRNVSRSNEALSQLTEASDRERELLQQLSTLQEELGGLRAELERRRSHSLQEEARLVEESEGLRERLEDARRDLKLNEEALAQTMYQYSGQLSSLKAELAVAASRLEQERQAREQLEAQAESARARLAGALQEAELCQAGRAEAEKALQRERDERLRSQDKRQDEAASQREAVSGLSQNLARAEGRANNLENELHRVTLSLTEKSLLLEALSREKEQACGSLRKLEGAVQAEREQAGRSGARQEATQERLAQVQSEAMLLRQQLEEAHNKGEAKERAVTDAQERFSDILAQLRSDCEERVQLAEERSKELAGKAADLREQVYKLEEERNAREAGVRQLQQELADSLKKLSMSEATLEVNTRYRNDLEDEKTRLLKDMDRLKAKLEESEDQYVQAERQINGLKSSVDERERDLNTSAHKLQEAVSASARSDTTIRQLEEAVQRLEIENARLEATAKQQTNKIEALQKAAQEAVGPSDSQGGGVRNRLEDLVTNLQGSKMSLEDQLNHEVQKQSVLSHTAQDSHALWEEELKSRSKLGLRLAELEKEKGELSSQMDMEKKKVRKIADQKKCVDTRLDQEMKRNTELQKEMYRLRTLVKTAKKRLREQEGAELGSPLTSPRGEPGRHSQSEAAVGRMKDKVEQLQSRLEKEASRCSQLERVNGDLKEQLASTRGLGRSHERLERSKRQLEEELASLRRQAEAGALDQSQADTYRRDAEERARQEVRQKLEEVNLFLQTQAASQEALEQMKAANEASLRSQLEQRIRELEGDLGRARSTQQDSLSQRDCTRAELERYRELYSQELSTRKALAAKLERLLTRSNERLAEANTKLLSERQRSKSLIANSIVNGSLGGPSLDVGSLGSVGAYGAGLGPLNRSLGLGAPLLSPLGDGSRVEAYLAKMQKELERNISKELDHAELEGSPARVSPVGSASGSTRSLGVELDPVSRATQQYLEVLKRNYMI
ncbi:ankyrin repeat domain-containing protein 26 [Osmerus eperlanus]|uniref:ankyrin repeat domain-containing protein 26 n=1 Tax=Osmerus eperlanus TaxID=29151 RepID=UPI002E0DBB18